MDKDREPGTIRQTAPGFSQQIYGPNVNRPLPEKHPFYELVGRVASEWAHVEHALDVTIWALAKMPMLIAPCLTSQLMGVGARCRAIILLAGVSGISEETKKKYRSLMSKAHDAGDLRNRIVHDPWYMKMAEREPTQFRAMPYSSNPRVAPHFGPQEVTEAEIMDALAKIRVLKKSAVDLHVIVGGELEALREKRP